MDIITVEYRRLVSHGEYENTTVGATARIDEGDSESASLQALRDWVEGQIASLVSSKDELYEARNTLQSLQYAVREHKRHLEDAKNRWNEAKSILESHGVTVPSEPRPWDDMPF